MLPFRTLIPKLSSVRPIFTFIRHINTAEIFENRHSTTQLKTTSQSLSFEHDYHVRSSLEKILHLYASKPYEKLTLNKLIRFGHKNLSETEAVTAANETLLSLKTLNARRLIHIRSLPYMVVLNPHISLSYSLYLQSMRELLKTPPIKNYQDALNFVNVCKDFSDKHADAIPRLSKGFTEIIGKFYPKQESFQFLDIHLRERIVMKLIAQHYVFLMDAPNSTSIGVVDLGLNINKLVENQAEFVNELCNIKYMKNCQLEIHTNEYLNKKDSEGNFSLLLEKDNEIVFPYIYENLEYCILELLKNSFRAHIENDVPFENKIEVTINKYFENNSQVPILQIRISDQGGGIHSEIQQQMYDFSFTTVKSDDDSDVYDTQHNRSVAGMGYGLGLSKTYCQIFGGTLHVESYWGYGTDVYLKLRGPDLSQIDE